MAIDSKIKYESLLALVNSTGWAVLKEEYSELMMARIGDAKRTQNKDEMFVKMQEYNTLEFCSQLPYIFLQQFKGEF